MVIWKTKPRLRPTQAGNAPTTPPLIGIMSKDAQSYAATTTKPRFAELTRGADLRGLLEIGGGVRLGADPEDPASVFLARAPGVFDRLIVDDSVSLLHSNWSRALFNQLLAMVRKGGQLVLPVRKDRPDRALGRWTVEKVAEHFGLEPTVLAGGDFVEIAADDAVSSDAPSVAGWFMDNALEVLLQHALLTATEADTSPDHDAILLKTDRLSLSDEGLSTQTKRIQRHLAQHCYYVGGIAYKAPLVEQIIRNHVRKPPAGLRYLDIGGGYGLLAAELGLSRELDFDLTACADIARINAALAARLYADLSDQLAGRFAFHHTPAENLIYDQSYDAISFIGSLLYVPKEALESVVARAWEAVSSGGALIIHENIKHPRFHKDFDVMFTVEEIDALLEPLGTVHRYASRLVQPLSKKEAGDKTVFRVVEKP